VVIPALGFATGGVVLLCLAVVMIANGLNNPYAMFAVLAALVGVLLAVMAFVVARSVYCGAATSQWMGAVAIVVLLALTVAYGDEWIALGPIAAVILLLTLPLFSHSATAYRTAVAAYKAAGAPPSAVIPGPAQREPGI
jgi:hypothetical protein